MKNIAIIGGAGFIGSHLIQELLNDGYSNITVYDNLSTGLYENIPANVDFIFSDINDVSTIEENFQSRKTDTVFFLAAKSRVQPSLENPIEYNQTNVSGLLNVLELCRKIKLKGRFIYSSSSSVYGNTRLPIHESAQCNPLSPYGLQKLIGEEYCKLYSRLFDIDTVCLRYFNVFGENKKMYNETYSNVLTIFENCRLNNQPLPVYNEGRQSRDFTYVKDVAKANIICAERTFTFEGESINVCFGKEVFLHSIVNLFGGSMITLRNVDNRGERIETMHTLGDNTRLKSLGWKPTIHVLDWIENRVSAI